MDAVKPFRKIALVGADTLLGAEVVKLLEERNFPTEALLPLAAEEGEEAFLEFRAEEVLVENLDQGSFEGSDLVLFCAGAETARRFGPEAVAAGALCIDTSGAWLDDPEVPLAVADLNLEELPLSGKPALFASPGGVALQLLALLQPLRVAGLRRAVVSTYQAVSGSGQEGIEELRLQTGELLNGRSAEPRAYPHPIAFNCLPQVGDFDEAGRTREEERTVQEVRKILGKEAPALSLTAVRVPVFYGDGVSLSLETEREILPARARELLADAPSVLVVDDPAAGLYPLPSDGAGEEAVLVGRIRADHATPSGLLLWSVTDGLRRQARNAVRIGEVLAGGRS